MTDERHLSGELLVRHMDGELPPAEAAEIDAHVAGCAECRRREYAWGRLSSSVDQAIRITPASEPFGARTRLAATLRAHAAARPRKTGSGRLFGRGMALAATLAAAIVLSPLAHWTGTKPPVPAPGKFYAADTIDINGEDFISLPYSNPDLPVNTSRIVQMQVPVASLVAAGVMYQNEPGMGFADRTVLANVLLGMDGQPLGIHVLNSEGVVE